MKIYKLIAGIALGTLLSQHAMANSWPDVIPGFNSTPILADRNLSKRLIIKYKSDPTGSVSLARSKNLISTYQLQVSKQFKSLPNIVVVDVDPMQSEQLFGQLSRDPAVEYVERDQPIELRTIPNDSRFNELWALRNNEFDSDVNAEQAWSITSGDKNAVVAVIDTGVAYTHNDLRNNIWINPGEIPDDGIDNDGNGKIDDIYGYDAGDNDSDPYDDVVGHGTHVAGIIGAQGNNGSQVTGINWNTSILACKIFSINTNELSGFVSDAIECLDYIWDLKQNHGINIIASNNSWGWVGAPSKALRDSIEKQKEAGILFVAAAGNNALNNDEIADNPSSYPNSNIISVASYNQFNEQSLFTNYGPHSVHISAPGEAILSTVPGQTAGETVAPPQNAVFYDSFEQGMSNWTSDANWSLSNTAFSGAYSVAFAPPAGGGIVSDFVSPTIDLSSSNQPLVLDIATRFSGSDYSLRIDVSSDGLNWNTLSYLSNSIGTGTGSWYISQLSIPAQYYASSFQFRLSSSYNYSDSTNFTINIDDVSILPESQHPLDTALRYASGTSMASPAVVGALALLYSQNSNRDWKQLKNLIIAGGKPFDTTDAETISNRRLRLADSDGSGSLTCNNQVVQKQLMPRKNDISFSSTKPSVNVEFLSINCDQPSPPQSLVIKENGMRIPLTDMGSSGVDQTAQDGVYSAKINLLQLGLNQVTLIFPNGEEVHASKSASYSYNTGYPYNWRNIDNPIDLNLADPTNDPAFVNSPFPIQFAGKSYSQLFVSLYGTLSFYYPRVGLLPPYMNTELPNMNYEPMIAPLWNDYDYSMAVVSWGVNGNAPNRELIVQWNVMPYNGNYLSANNGEFQVVFFENSSNILFNYNDVDFGLQSYDNGESASIGIQTSSLAATMLDPTTNPIANASSIMWTYDVNGNGNGNNNPINKGSSGNSDDSGFFGSFDSQTELALLLLVLWQAYRRRDTGRA